MPLAFGGSGSRGRLCLSRLHIIHILPLHSNSTRLDEKHVRLNQWRLTIGHWLLSCTSVAGADANPAALCT